MEVKVLVDGVPRVVCGVTEKTTCQEVVIALAQALGQPGRYTLREKFKDFERSVTPSERLLESLERYGQQAREVQLTLLHNGPSVWEGTSKSGRYQPAPQMRKTDAAARMRRGRGSLSLHRQSLPPISRLRQQAEQPPEEVRPKRKSLTLMEEAWGWLENLGKGGIQHSANDKGSNKRSDKRSGSSLDVPDAVAKDTSPPGGLLSKLRVQKSGRANADRPMSCCMGDQASDKDSKYSRKARVVETKAEDLQMTSGAKEILNEKRNLRETLIRQMAFLKELQAMIASTDRQIRELEDLQKARKAEQEAQQNIIEEETEQLLFWENELKAEDGYEKDLQRQFLEMKEKALDCKAKLEEYKNKMNGLDFFAIQKNTQEEPVKGQRKCEASSATDSFTFSNKALNQPSPISGSDMNVDRKFPPRKDSNVPHALVPPNQIKVRRPTGPTELREWWTHWSNAQSSKTDTKPKVIHRTELTVHLGSTRV